MYSDSLVVSESSASIPCSDVKARWDKRWRNWDPHEITKKYRKSHDAFRQYLHTEVRARKNRQDTVSSILDEKRGDYDHRHKDYLDRLFSSSSRENKNASKRIIPIEDDSDYIDD